MGRLHPNVLKVRKQTRMRRAYLRGTDIASEIKVKRRIGTGDIPEEHVDYFAYRRRGNTFWDPYLEAKFPSRGQISRERYAVLDKIAEWGELVIEEMNVIVHRGGITKTLTRMFFNSDYTYVFFTKEDYLNMAILKSIPFHGSGARERAMFALANNGISWIESTELSSLIPDSPKSG